MDIIYIDLANAFDTVSHQKMLHKLAAYGFGGVVLTWIKSFLQGRSQRVKIENVYSETQPVLSGIPQGTLIGPLLFIIFIND